jgi:hypothetical protein
MNDLSSREAPVSGLDQSEEIWSGETLAFESPLDLSAASSVWSCNEWDQLEEFIVGNPLNARFPTRDPSTQLAEFPDRPISDIPRGTFPQYVIDETEEDLNEFAATLESCGVKVRRPDTWPHDATFSTINWESHGYYNYCPRDVLLVVGDQIIETPNVIRSRSQETFSYRSLLMEYWKSGAKWISAPKPMLLDSLFEGVDLERPTPRNDEPAFDAANILRFGEDLIYLVSATGTKWADSGFSPFSATSIVSTISKMCTTAVISILRSSPCGPGSFLQIRRVSTTTLCLRSSSSGK